MIQPTCRNFDIYLHGKIWTPSLTSFLRYCKVLQTCYFEYFENTWSCPSIITEINLAEINFAVYLLAKKSISSPTFSLRYCKDVANLVFWELWESLTIPIKTIVLICRKPSCSSSCKKSTSSPTSFIRYYNEIVNLLFCVLWACLALTLKVMLSTCSKLLCLSAGKKATSSPMFFWRYCKDIQT